jgi:FHS family L-fucose permease-like MFS transporter
MLSVTSAIAILFVLIGMFAPETTPLNLPVLKSEGGVTSFGLVEVPMNAIFFVLVGLCTSIMWGAIFNLAVEGLGKYVAAASGIFMTLVCGGGILPLIQGKIADEAGYMPSYWLVVALLAYLFFYAVAGSKNVNKDIEV